ncbi:MAG: DUF3052 domain-containing protein [Micrococcus sp.]|nr:DUF3052 domain-containing protein [Micrococcus sp.]
MDAESTHTVDAEHVLAELGLEPGWYVQEWGYDEDVDESLRDALQKALGTELQDEADQEPVEAVILWWREDDGDATDLSDTLMDAQASLDEGPVWLLTPRKGREGHVDPADVQEAAPVSGLHVTTGAGVSENWSATRLVKKRGG